MFFTKFLGFLLVLVSTGFVSITTFAQLDPSFGVGGITRTSIYSNDFPYKSFALPDGKILVVHGNQFQGAGIGLYSLVRFNSDGTRDTTYGTNGVVNLNLPFISSQGFISTIARQPDGKLIFVGSDNNVGLVMRFNENGTLDGTFANGGVHRPNITFNQYDVVTNAVVQPDGKIVVAGYTGPLGSNYKLFLLRYQPDGSLDWNYGNNGFIIYNLPRPVLSIVLQSNGKLIVPTQFGLSQPGTIYRFNADGSQDSVFSSISFNFDYTRDVLVQPDDKILVSDSVQKNDSLERKRRDVRVWRYNENGSTDSGFGTGGFASADIGGYFDETSGKLGILSDGQIIASAITNITANRSNLKGHFYSLLRFSPGGTLNGKFLITNTFEVTVPEILPISDGKVLGITTINQGGERDLLMAQVTGVPLTAYHFKGNPFDFGSSDSAILPDGKADVTVFRENQSFWYINPLGNPFYFGLPGDIPIPRDYFKDYGSELAIFRPNTGTWYISRDFLNPGQNFFAVQWGLAGDIPIPRDYDGDSKADIAVFRASEGNWYIRNSNGSNPTIIHWGMPGDKPVPGDFDGDGIDDIAVWRPSNGVWYILKSSDGQAVYINFGLSGDVPVQEDYDGDGKTDIAVWRPSNGAWYILNSTNGQSKVIQWGILNDIPTPADFDGDLKSDISVWRPSNHTWYIIQSSTGTSTSFSFGLNTDIPVQGRY